MLGEADALSLSQTPAVGTYSFDALYNGDASYVPSTSACLPVSVIAP
mgnify:CR=1 FL=1